MKNIDKIKQNLSIIPNTSLVEVEDESGSHKHGKDSHYRVFVVSDYFKEMKNVDRHRTIYIYTKDIPYHALGITAMTHQEYTAGKLQNTSPKCQKNT